MFLLFLMWILTVAAAAIPARLLFQKRLSLHRDFFFLFIYLQILVYLHFAPSSYAPRLSSYLQELYCWMQAAVIILFEIPMTWIYLRLMGKRRQGSNRFKVRMQVRPRRQLVFVVASLGLCLAYLEIALGHGVMFHWLGPLYPVVMGSLARWQFYSFRIFVQDAPFVVLMLVLSLYFEQTRKMRSATIVAAVVTGGTYLVQSAFNSRLATAYFVVMLVGIAVMKRKSAKMPKLGQYGRLLIVGLLILYFARVALITRRYYNDFGLRLDYFNPFFSESWNVTAGLPWDFRLNGIDAMARMTGPAWEHGFAWGAAWKDPLYVYFGQFIGAKDVGWMKDNFMVDAKYYWLVNYLNLQNFTMDYPSALPTDAYANFFLLGILMCAPLVAWPCAYATRQIRSPSSVNRLLFGVVFLLTVISLENEVIGLFLNFLKLLPVVAPVVVLQPWRIRRERIGKEIIALSFNGRKLYGQEIQNWAPPPRTRG